MKTTITDINEFTAWYDKVTLYLDQVYLVNLKFKKE